MAEMSKDSYDVIDAIIAWGVAFPVLHQRLPTPRQGCNKIAVTIATSVVNTRSGIPVPEKLQKLLAKFTIAWTGIVYKDKRKDRVKFIIPVLRNTYWAENVT